MSKLGTIANHFSTTMTERGGDEVEIECGFCKGHRVEFVKADARAAAGKIGKGFDHFFSKLAAPAKWIGEGIITRANPEYAKSKEMDEIILSGNLAVHLGPPEA